MIGIDVISISRMERFMSKYGEKALSKFLTSNEIALAKTPKTIAGFWAVKEAVSKALGCGIGAEFSFFDLEISKTIKGAPLVHFSEKALTLHSIKRCEVSITHDADLAIAVAFLVK
jgi:holo-[acyl-carrier protein] synthase